MFGEHLDRMGDPVRTAAERTAAYRERNTDHSSTQLFVKAEDWMREGACQGYDHDLFFPSRGESVAAIKAICNACPVQTQCLEYALGHNEKYGIWGGTSERERRRIRSQRRRERGAA